MWLILFSWHVCGKGVSLRDIWRPMDPWRPENASWSLVSTEPTPIGDRSISSARKSAVSRSKNPQRPWLKQNPLKRLIANKRYFPPISTGRA